MDISRIFRDFAFPVLIFGTVNFANHYLNAQVDGAFFSLYLLGVLSVSYFSGTLPAVIVTILCFLKLLFFDLTPKKLFLTYNIDESYRLFFFLLGSALIIVVIRRLRNTARENSRLLKGQEELLAVVSHDLRNPLNAIRLHAEILDRKLGKTDGNEEHQKRSQTIIQNCASMNLLIEDLLEFARLGRGKSSLNLTRGQTPNLFSKVSGQLAPLAQNKKIRLQFEDSAKIEFCADHEKLLRVFSNIIGNAIKFTPEEGLITVSAVTEGKALKFSVADSGPGIAEEQLAHIFDRYWQSGAQASKGMGLGLAISKSIVEGHGGALTVASKLGQGTTFTFTIPQ